MTRRKKVEAAADEGYARAKRHVRPMPITKGSWVVYEDGAGIIHAHPFSVLRLLKDDDAVIKGWPDGARRKGDPPELTVQRSQLVRLDQVKQEALKAMFNVPEDTARTQRVALTIEVSRKK